MDKKQLVGTWSLISSVQTCNGVGAKTFGDPPSGQLHYSSEGRMAAFLMHPCWSEQGQNASIQADLFFSYAGTWDVIEDEVHHFISYCSVPSKIGRTFIRQMKFLGASKIELTTAPESTPSGKVYQSRLIWKRL